MHDRLAQRVGDRCQTPTPLGRSTHTVKGRLARRLRIDTPLGGADQVLADRNHLTDQGEVQRHALEKVRIREPHLVGQLGIDARRQVDILELEIAFDPPWPQLVPTFDLRHRHVVLDRRRSDLDPAAGGWKQPGQQLQHDRRRRFAAALAGCTVHERAHVGPPVDELDLHVRQREPVQPERLCEAGLEGGRKDLLQRGGSRLGLVRPVELPLARIGRIPGQRDR